MTPATTAFTTTINIEGEDVEVEIVAEGMVGLETSYDADGRFISRNLVADLEHITINDLKGEKLYDAISASNGVYDQASTIAVEKLIEEYLRDE
jgi:hypothetical protein